MSARIDQQADAAVAALENAAPAPLPAPFAPPVEGAAEADERWGNGPSLPSDHAAWMRDSLSVSQRARALLAKLAPVVTRAIAFWEHRVKSIVVSGRTLSVDASGSYRFE